MSTLLHPLSLSMIRSAADEVASDALQWAKYSAEIGEHLEEIISDALKYVTSDVESAPVTDREDVEAIVSDFCEEVAGSLEMSRDNGLASDVTDGDVIYTSDILDYYAENTDEVDEALAHGYGDLREFNTIGEAMSTGVALALDNIAESEISEVMHAFETWAKEEMVNLIFA